jgi:hypothetical protein
MAIDQLWLLPVSKSFFPSKTVETSAAAEAVVDNTGEPWEGFRGEIRLERERAGLS